MQVAKKRNFLENISQTPYVELEYIETDGNSYIMTGIYPNSNMKLESKVLMRGTLGMFQTDRGWTENQAITNGPMYGLAHCQPYYMYGGGGFHAGGDVTQENAFEIIIDKGKIYKDNILITDRSAAQIINACELPLFANNRNNSIIELRSQGSRIYYFKITERTLLIDLIPVKDLQGTVCMYDKVSGNFFYNQGTGDFIAGPEKNISLADIQSLFSPSSFEVSWKEAA